MTEERSESAAGLSFKMGEALLRNGAEIFRVQETMERVARAYDIEEYDVYVLSNAIFANAVENGEKIDTKLKFVPGSTIHFGRIVGINQLSREIVAGKVSVEEAYARLHEIVSIPYTHPIRPCVCRRQRVLQLPVWRHHVRRRCGAHLRLCFAGVPKRHR